MNHMNMIAIEDCCEILDSMRVPVTAADREKGQYPYYGANGIQDYIAGYIFDDELVLLAEDGGNFGSKDRPIAYRVSGKCWVNNHAHVLKPKEGLNVDYLCYALMFYKVDGMINGATRQKLTQTSMKKMQIPLRSMKEQVQIVDRLNRIIKIKEQRLQELQLLEKIVKARFVEMFENREYNVVRLGDVCTKITDGMHKTPNYLDDGITFISAKNIVNGELDFSNVKYISEDEYMEIQKRCQTEKYDILLSKSGSLGTPVIVKTEEKIGLFESLAVIKYDRTKLIPEFLCEQLKTEKIQRQFKIGTKGVAIKHLHLGVIADIRVIVPDLEKQKEFADFVRVVDKSKVEVQKALDKTQMLFDSLMQQYFG